MLAGLSKNETFRTPPDFWATAGAAAAIAVTRAAPAILQRRLIAIGIVSRCGGYWSSQTSSMRKLLMMLLTIIVQPLTCGCQQYAKRL
jgi:hypothetical protein